MLRRRVNGYDISYIEVGEGIPLVCVHGTLGDFRVWSPIMGPCPSGTGSSPSACGISFPSTGTALAPTTRSPSTSLMWSASSKQWVRALSI